MADQPLGPVLHIVRQEAIVKPHKAFVAKGATVVTLDNKIIGKLGDPIGRVDQPYQVIKLNKSAPEELVGQLVVAKLGGTTRNKRNRNRKKKRS